MVRFKVVRFDINQDILLVKVALHPDLIKLAISIGAA